MLITLKFPKTIAGRTRPMARVFEITVPDVVMSKVVSECRSINYCLCTVLVNCTVMYSFLGQR